MEDPIGDLEIIDTERMASLVESLGTALADIIDVYLEDMPGQIARLEAAYQRGDLAEVQQIAHTMKSSAGIFGAQRIVALCQTLESAPEGADQAALIERISVEYEKLRPVLNLYRKPLS